MRCAAWVAEFGRPALSMLLCRLWRARCFLHASTWKQARSLRKLPTLRCTLCVGSRWAVPRATFRHVPLSLTLCRPPAPATPRRHVYSTERKLCCLTDLEIRAHPEASPRVRRASAAFPGRGAPRSARQRSRRASGGRTRAPTRELRRTTHAVARHGGCSENAETRYNFIGAASFGTICTAL